MANLVQITKFLQQRKLPYKVINLMHEAFTVADVVDSGIDEDEVAKTLIVRTNGGPSTSLRRAQGRSGSTSFVALALRGNDRVDFKKVRRLFGSKSELAKPEEVRKVIGVPVGAVCPILIGIPLYFDRKVMDLMHVNMGSGDLKKGLEMEFPDLLKAVGKYEAEDLTN